MKLDSIARFAGLLACAGVLHVSAVTAATEKVLHVFKGGNDGADPQAGLINVNGTLYGTTYAGGTGYCEGVGNCGVVFSISRSGTNTVLHSFGSNNDGENPVANLININGTLYGTTLYGGTYTGGTVFSITPGGTESVLYSFGNTNDGYEPEASLISIKGKLYGTTWNTFGCASICGTVFSVTQSGAEEVLHSFHLYGDGAGPAAALTKLNGILFGTTSDGGPDGYGTIYSITRSGTEKVVYLFNIADGSSPVASLINVNGTLYGTTQYGGKYFNGTVFSVTPSGIETVLYSFKGGSDGANPAAALLNINGTLYGTTQYGGTGTCSFNGSNGCGTVFSISLSGTESVLYSFKGASDGAYPVANLIDVKGTLYGTTFSGGATNCTGPYGEVGCGTVFSITP